MFGRCCIMLAMKSPFPGMDPYLETRWSDVHVTLLTYIGEALQPLLPPDLRARAEERAATMEPILVEVAMRPPFERFVQIINVSNGNRVVTVIEILSPWNKRSGRRNDEYRQKIDDYADAGVNVVEIDLLRSSRGRLCVGQEDLPVERRTPYLVCVRRAQRADRWEVYPVPLREPLPRIPVPLREKDADVSLDLQPLIERVYVAGGHDDINYAVEPDPPLQADDARWADELLKSAGRR